jgi:glucose uptake protein GlcU
MGTAAIFACIAIVIAIIGLVFTVINKKKDKNNN